MCGIAGYVGRYDQGVLASMSDALIHRGPDSYGVYSCQEKGVNLVHRRLIIVDPEGGHQPLWNEDMTVCIVFNGEVYNHLELRQELRSKGHLFKSNHSDTEVLVHGYEEWGVGLLNRINGMFAFCIYDKKKGALFFGRDRFGKKPLYYSQFNDGFAFASELKSLLKHPAIKTHPDLLSVQRYFAYGFIPAPQTLYEKVYKLPAGSYMQFELDSRRLSIGTYYNFTVDPDESLTTANEQSLCEELMARLRTATARRMVADRPIGVFLSGGIDSSAVLSCMSETSIYDEVRTFSIGFSKRSFDESATASCIASYYKATNYKKIVDFRMASEAMLSVTNRLDEPMADSSIIPTYLLAKFAKESVDVALTGDGADELLGGYAPFLALRPATIYKKLLPQFAQKTIKQMVNSLPTSDKYMSFDFKVKRALMGLGYDERIWNPVWLSPLEAKDISELLMVQVSNEELYADAIAHWDKSEAPDIIGKTTEFYVKFYLQDDILTKVDRATMMVGLEARSPFLDNDFVEFARRLPTTMRVRGRTGKYILKRAMCGRLPFNPLKTKKRGFAMPASSWLRTMDMPEYSNVIRYDNHFIKRKLTEHLKSRRDERLFLWAWLVLQSHLRSVDS